MTVYKPYTLLLPLHPTHGVLLGLKKRGFGAGKWNGFGGKPEPGDPSLLATAIRELHEESGLLVRAPEAVATRGVLFLHSGGDVREALEIWVYTVDVRDCDGEIVETEEMAPRYFPPRDLPFAHMWEESRHWLPAVVSGERAGQAVFHSVDFADGWEGIVSRVEEWVEVSDGHGGREGALGERARGWVRRVRAARG